ncbi:MAG: hypothetical protein QJR02_10030 [Sinobacteraceae bacterium]|nr:hypothetical protein [Nevskiaceae bacterium]
MFEPSVIDVPNFLRSIELIDGEKLVDMLERLELGLRPVKTYQVDFAFFKEFES